MVSSGAALDLLGWLAGSSVSTAGAVAARAAGLALAPLHHREMLWVALPLLAMIASMELYFGIYADEELGWNSATANSLFLVLISLDLARKLFSQVPFSLEGVRMEMGLFAIALALLALGLVLFILNFKHVLPKRLAFSLTATLPVNIFAYFAVAVVYSNLSPGGEGIPLDMVTGVAAAVLFMTAALFFGLVHLVLRRDRLP